MELKKQSCWKKLSGTKSFEQKFLEKRSLQMTLLKAELLAANDRRGKTVENTMF